MSSIKVLIVDDHSIIRRGLRFLLETYFRSLYISETESIKLLNQMLEEGAFTHLVLDMQLKDGNIIDVFQQIRAKYPELRIIIYTTSPEEIFGKRMLQLGANGFLSKQSQEEEVVRALRIFFEGGTYISSFLEQQMKEQKTGKLDNINPFNELSEREISVLNYLLKGETVKDISVRLQLKSSTVATYKARIFDKLGVSNTMDIRNLADLHLYHTS